MRIAVIMRVVLIDKDYGTVGQMLILRLYTGFKGGAVRRS
jgi:hypothetical protein